MLPHTSNAEWHFLHLNPEPWTSPNVGIGRRNGKPFPQVYKDAGLRAYQEGVKEVLSKRNLLAFEAGKPIDIGFFFWRRLPDYATDRERRARKHVADATNLQKALEDALQGILFHNDRDVQHVESWIMEQGYETEPCIGIRIAPAGPPPQIDVPRPQANLDLDRRPDYEPETLF